MINLGKVKAAHKRFLAAHAAMIKEELETAAKLGEAHPSKHATFKHRTHALERATKGKIIKTARGHIVKLTNRKQYAAAIDLGAKPHVILPRRAKFLRFPYRGAIVFARKVNHPGNKPYRFLYRAMNAAYRIAGPNLESGMQRIAKKF